MLCSLVVCVPAEGVCVCVYMCVWQREREWQTNIGRYSEVEKKSGKLSEKKLGGAQYYKV